MAHSGSDFEMHARLEELVERGILEKGTPAHGIALQVADSGDRSLSPAQRSVYERVVLPALSTPLTDDEAFRAALRQDWEDEARNPSD